MLSKTYILNKFVLLLIFVYVWALAGPIIAGPSAKTASGYGDTVLEIEYNGNDISARQNPVGVKRGVQFSISVETVDPGVKLTPGCWTLSSQGTPAGSISWETYAGMDYAVAATALTPTQCQDTSISYRYTTTGQHMAVLYTTNNQSNTTNYTATTHFTAYDAKPTAHDTQFNLDAWWNYYDPASGWTVQNDYITEDIPPTQVVYPFTPAPNIYASAESAAGRGLPYDNTFWSDFCPNNSIGDWGKGAFFYPDLTVLYGGSNMGRRLAANFRFGAMGESASIPLWIQLAYAESASLIHNLQHHRLGLHTSDEQMSIMAGWYWWQNTSRPAISDGGAPLVHVACEDSAEIVVGD